MKLRKHSLQSTKTGGFALGLKRGPQDDGKATVYHLGSATTAKNVVLWTNMFNYSMNKGT